MKSFIMNFFIRPSCFLSTVFLVNPFLGSEGIAIMTTGQNLSFFAILILGLIFLFRLLCLKKKKESVFLHKFMYISILCFISFFCYCLRIYLYSRLGLHFSDLFSFMILSVGGGQLPLPGPSASGSSSSSWNFEASPPAMSQQGGIPGENEPGISGESPLRNLEQPRGDAGASSWKGREVLQGTPILEKDMEDALASPFYCSGVVHIPGEIEDPLTLSKLSDFNKFLVNMRYDFYEGVIQPGYTQSLQRELDETPTGSLPAKLDSMLSRERAKFYTREGGSSLNERELSRLRKNFLRN